jgi:hypothetical protein
LLHKDGAVQLLGRTKQVVVGQTWSQGGGKTWIALTATDLPTPNSGTDAVTLADVRHLIVYNHSGHRAPEQAAEKVRNAGVVICVEKACADNCPPNRVS